MGLKQTFGNNLHSYRKLRGFSQEQLAEKLEISIKHLSTLETGKVFASSELIEKIAEELKVSISALFYTPDEKSFDETDMAKIEAILEEEVNKFLINVKNKLRTINQI